MFNSLNKLFKRKYKIILIRHGQSEGNVDPSVYKRKYDHQIELTEIGIDQSVEAGKKLKKIVKNKRLDVYVSPYKRTRQTWSGIKKGLDRNNLNVDFDPRIREQEHKIFKNAEERITKFNEQREMGRFYYRFKNAESGVDVYSRTTTFLKELFVSRKVFGNRNDVVVIAHEIVLRSIIMRLYRLKDFEFDDLPEVQNCSPIVLDTYDFDKADINQEESTGNQELMKFLKERS